jgi:hypothetical protein
MANSNRPTIQARLAKAINGIGKRLQGAVPNVVLVGVTYTLPQAIAFFQSAIDSVNAVAAAKAKWQDAVKADRVLLKNVFLALLDLQNIARALFGNATDPLADFGFTPRKTNHKRTGATIVGAAAKSKATRTARHTMGSKQKKAVKGTVQVPAAQASASPAAPAATPTGSNGPAAPAAPSGVAQQAPSNGSAPHGA